MIRISIFLFALLITYCSFAQNNDAQLINQETSIYLKNGKLNKTLLFEVKINNRVGEKFTKVIIPYSKMSTVSKIDAYITDNNQRVIKKLKKSDINNRSRISNFSFYEDSFVYEFTLKHNIYPYYIHYSYNIQQEEFLFIDYWVPVLDEKTPTLKATLNVELPKDYQISFSNSLIDTFEVVHSQLLTNYTWHAYYQDAIKPETYSPPIINFLPSVVIVLQNFKYEIDGSLESWVTFGDWEYELIQHLSDLPQYEKNRISMLVDGIVDDREKIKKLYHDLQDETRYINITIETGGLRPFPASYVVKNKYGDCKALTNYFKSALEYIDIESFYTNIHAGEPIIEINKELPSQQFNHVILCVPIDNDTLWLDCTSKKAFNYLGTFTQNRDAYIIKKNNSHFTRTPSLQNLDVLEIRRITIYQDLQKNVIANFSNTYRGDKYESLLDISHSFNQSEKSKIIQDYFIEEGLEVIDFSLVEAHRDSSEIHLLYTAKSNNIINIYGDDILINLIPFSIPKLEKPKNRKLPVQFDYPIYMIDTIDYLLPEGYSVSKTPKNQKMHNEFGHYEIEFNQRDSKFIVTKSFLLNSGNYYDDEYKSLYDFINRINEIENNSHIVIVKSK